MLLDDLIGCRVKLQRQKVLFVPEELHPKWMGSLSSTICADRSDQRQRIHTQVPDQMNNLTPQFDSAHVSDIC